MSIAKPPQSGSVRVLKKGALAVLVLLVGGLAGLNLVDYWRYRRAVQIEQRLGQEGMRELAAICVELGKDGSRSREPYPAPLAALQPVWFSVDRKRASIGLYRRDKKGAVFLRFEREGENEIITLCDYARGQLDERLIYVKDRAAYEVLHPKGRIVTLALANGRYFAEWIVLPHEVRVICLTGESGAYLEGARSITSEERHKIEAAVRALPDRLRGRHFTSRAIDGAQLDIRLEADGQPGGQDVELANTWREEVGPLVDLVTRLSPPGPKLRARYLLQDDFEGGPHPQYELTLQEAAEQNQISLPWWCLWPRLSAR